jgi:hypothetical protein
VWLAPSGPVPRNVKLWLARGELLDSPLRLRGRGGDRLLPRDPTSWYDGFVAFAPGPLAPDEPYELSAETWGWTFGSFTTTDDEDHEPPRTPVVRSFEVAHLSDLDHSTADDPPDSPAIDTHWMHGVARAAPANDIAIDLDLSDDTVFVDVELSDGAARFHAVMWPGDLDLLGRTACGPQVHVHAGATPCLAIRAIDLAGNISEPARRCTIAVDRPGQTTTEPRRSAGFPNLPVLAPRLWPRLAIALAPFIAFGAWVHRATRRRRSLAQPRPHALRQLARAWVVRQRPRRD